MTGAQRTTRSRVPLLSPNAKICTISSETDFWSPYGAIKKKLMDYQKQWKARCAHILKAPFNIPDAPEHNENGVYMLGKKDLQEVVVELTVSRKQIWSSTIL